MASGTIKLTLVNQSEEEDDAGASGQQGQTGQSGEPSTLGHQFFDRLGEAAQFSNAFDMGSFDLSEQLRAFEAELDRDSGAATEKRVRRGHPWASPSPRRRSPN